MFRCARLAYGFSLMSTVLEITSCPGHDVWRDYGHFCEFTVLVLIYIVLYVVVLSFTCNIS